MKKSAIVLFFAAFLSVGAFAQSVQEGINHLYAQRYQSAKATFEKLLAANPNNIEANYWLGQTYIGENKLADAKSVYQKAAASSNNAPLIVVGLGEIDLMEGKAPEARQQFETAINASHGKKGNDPNVLNAIGRANIDAYTEKSKMGDLDYAIAKLNEAAQLAPNNADIFLNLGNAYRKKTGSGGLAITNYMKAKQINPALAAASYRAALLYKTQVKIQYPDNWSVVLENLNNAIAADPTFAPAYFELYYYYLLGKRDFATAETYSTKYISNSDPSVENDYIKAQTDWIQNKFTESISTLKNIVSQTNNNAKPRVYRLLAYDYMGVKDTAQACEYVNQFFTKAGEDDVVGQDYILHAQSCGKNNPDIIRTDVMKAVEADTVLSSKIKTLRDFAKEAKASGLRVLEATLGAMAYKLEGADANPTRLISDIAVPYYFGGAYLQSDSASKAYSALLPDSIYGYHWSAIALSAIDTALTEGLAIPSFEKSLEVAERDKVRFKSQGVRAAQTLAVYYYNIKDDKTAALDYVNRGLAFDPTNPNLLKIKEALETPVKQAPAAKPPTKKTSTSSNAAKDTRKTTPAKAKTKG
jgi:tetratricopeptide (TPR) repeat protein